jgi:predicted nuclease of restriction endonuclease-like (RecB) superfamily
MKIESSKEYRDWLNQIKSKIHSVQIKAALEVNKSLLSLYWTLGKMIVDKQTESGWGNAVVERLSIDLKKGFPEMKGFSRANLFSIRKWYLFYSVQDKKVQQLVGQIPWGHNILIINKIKDYNKAEFYINATVANNWSRNVLLHQIETNLYDRKRHLTHNFDVTLPKPQSDLARETLKDPYIFDFLTIGEEAHERDLENQLVQNITRFLLELGVGFTYVGRQYNIEVGGQDYFIDLLFYHLRLRCFVAIELKVGEFKPEYAGKINFYLSALDKLVKTEQDNPSIGIILCKTRNKIIAEYALRDMSKPIGVSEYKFTEAVPEELKSSLPTIEELETGLIENL